jgi:2,6-dihydroxypseudooxynicotine hydrolase
MAQDEKIAGVIDRWAPRFISNGVPLSDYQEVTASLEHWVDWCHAWSARAARHEVAGREALVAGNTVCQIRIRRGYGANESHS